MTEPNFRKKNPLGRFWSKKGPRDFFFENRALSLFSVYGPLSSCRKSEKTNDPILRKTLEGRTDRGRTDEGEFIEPQSAKAGVQLVKMS